MPQNLINQANHHYQAGNFQDAGELCRQVLQEVPNHPRALCLLGMIATATGQPAQAIQVISKAIEQEPANPHFWNNMGLALEGINQPGEALGCYQRAIGLDGKCIEAWASMAILLQSQNRIREAEEAYQAALKIDRNCVDVLNNYGNFLLSRGDVENAIRNYKKAIRLDRNYALPRFGLGNAYRMLGQADEALAEYREAARLDPNFVEARMEVGGLLKDPQEALAVYRQVLERWPGHWTARARMGFVHELHDDIDQAREMFYSLAELQPDNVLWPLKIASLCDPVARNAQAIDNYRRHLEETMARLQTEPLGAPMEMLLEAKCQPPFAMAYQGRDDNPLKSRYADLLLEKMGKLPGLSPPAAKPTEGRKIKLGFVVTEHHEGVFLKFMRGFLRYLSRERLDVHVVVTQTRIPHLKQAMGDLWEQVNVVAMPLTLPAIVSQLRSKDFDILFFFEIGTDTKNYFLPFFRLAPVQCTSWGWPVTSGIPNVDYFLSSEAIEPEGAEAHYREKLVRFKHLPSYYFKPEIPAVLKSREELGLPQDKHLYSCPQSLNKFHPDFDAILADILNRDPEGLVILLEGKEPLLAERLRERFAKTLPNVADRIRFLPRLEHVEFLSLLAQSDVLLDPIHFGGGATSYESFLMGTPIVTLPGEFMRGRVTYGMYQVMDIGDCVAESPQDYAAIAVRLATEPDFRAAVSSRIRAASDRLFEDMEAVRELEAFCIRAMEEATRQHSSLQGEPHLGTV